LLRDNFFVEEQQIEKKVHGPVERTSDFSDKSAASNYISLLFHKSSFSSASIDVNPGLLHFIIYLPGINKAHCTEYSSNARILPTSQKKEAQEKEGNALIK
jgi:hypothetical protein